MSNDKTGGPAFPVHSAYQDCGIDGNSGPVLTETISNGLSKREIFAMTAMQAIISNPSLIGSVNDKNSIEYIRVHSVVLADAVLSELENKAAS